MPTDWVFLSSVLHTVDAQQNLGFTLATYHGTITTKMEKYLGFDDDQFLEWFQEAALVGSTATAVAPGDYFYQLQYIIFLQ